VLRGICLRIYSNGNDQARSDNIIRKFIDAKSFLLTLNVANRCHSMFVSFNSRRSVTMFCFSILFSEICFIIC